MSMPAAMTCTCSHSVNCNHDCHGRHCDPTEHVCSIEFLPDEGGLALYGCADCTPGEGLAHLAGCPADLSTEASAARREALDVGDRPQPSAPLS